ncbi:MAG: DUF4405 domain-containing protein [Archaeoglobaceae archaeon]
MGKNIRLIVFMFSLFFGFVSLITGLVLYFWPKPRAGWYSFLGLNKQTWSDLHTYFSLIALLVVIVHLIVNRKSIKLYFEWLKKS